MEDQDYLPSARPVQDIVASTVDYATGDSLLSRTADMATKGLLGAAISGTMSIVNTFVDTEDTGTVRDIIDRVGGEDYAEYYDAHKEGVDLAGFMLGTVATYGAGTAMLKLARAGYVGAPLARVLNILPDKNQTAVANAIAELAKPGGSMAYKLSSTVYQRLGWSVADNLLTTAVGEAATLALMKDSPFLDGYSTGDFIQNMALGGVIGGGLQYVAGRAVLKSAATTVEQAAASFAGERTASRLGMEKQNEILMLTDDLTKLPVDFKQTEFKYTYDGKSKETKLDTEDLFKQTRERTLQTGMDQVALMLNELSGNNVNIGQAMAERVINRLKTMGVTEAERAAARDDIQGWLLPVSKLVSNNDVELLAEEGTKFYFNRAGTAFATESITAPKHVVGLTNKQPYILNPGVKVADIVAESAANGTYKSAKEAFANGADVWYAKNGNAMVNPKSSRVSKASDVFTAKSSVMDLESGTVDYNPIFTIGDDISNPGTDVILTADKSSLVVKGKVVKVDYQDVLPLETTTRDSSTRYLHASKLEAKDLKQLGEIDAQNLPLMDRVAELRAELPDEFIVRLADGSETTLGEIGDVAKFAKQQKIYWTLDYHTSVGSIDERELAVHLNTSQKWAHQVIASGFNFVEELNNEVRATNMAARPRTVGFKFNKNDQLFRGTDSLGNKISGALVERITKQEFNPKGLLEYLGIPLTRGKAELDAALGYDTSKFFSAPEGQNAFAISGAKEVGKAVAPGTELSVYPKAINVDKGFRTSDNSLLQVVAHELGHTIQYAVDRFFATVVDGRLVARAAELPPEVRVELTQISKQFRPRSWITQSSKYMNDTHELFADAMATYMLEPEKRARMPEFRKHFGDRIQEFEQFFKQQVWQRTNGPALGADAMLAHQYEAKMKASLVQTAVRATLPEFAQQLLPIDSAMAKTIDSLGVGPTAVTSANSAYGSLKNAMEYLGRTMAEWKAKLGESAAKELRDVAQAISTDVDAAAELGIITSKLRRSGEKFFPVKVEYDEIGMALDVPRTHFVSERTYKLMQSGEKDFYQAVHEASVGGHEAYLPIASQKVVDFLERHVRMNDDVQSKKQVILNSIGLGRSHEAGMLYIPPIDTARYPHIAFVKQRDGIGASNQAAMITARTPEQLQKLIAELPKDFVAYTKNDVENFYRAKGSYDYSMMINDTRVDSQLRRMAKLGDFYPETRAENVLDDYVRFHVNQSHTLLSTAMQSHYAELFSQLKYLSNEFTQADTSIAKGKLATLQRKFVDPYGDYIRTALDQVKLGQYPILDELNDLIDNVGKKAWSAVNAVVRNPEAGVVDWQKANSLAQQYGLGTPFSNVDAYRTANEVVPKNLIATTVGKLNWLLTTFGLRLDVANSLVNVLSTPIMLGMEHRSITENARKNPELAGKLAELYSTKVPGRDYAVPSYTKLVYNAINNFYKDDGVLMNRYKPLAGISDILDDHKSLLRDIEHKPWQGYSKLAETADNWVNKASKLTGNEFSENFTRFVTADVMRQQTDILVQAGKMTVAEANSYIATFVNRVQGNYLQSQRPLLFQGTSGRAVSLFQTYMFNVFQQLGRHIEDKNARAIFTFAGLQGSIYGLNGLPYFDAVNTHLVSKLKSNPERKDAYSELPGADTELGNWLLYGTASAMPLFDGHGPALYSRGDLNPRTLIGLPTSIGDIPAVGATVKIVDTVRTFAKNISNGGDFTNSMLFALEHQGMSRPLAGLAQIASGRSTDSKGALIAATNELYTTAQLASLHPRTLLDGVTRVAGAKPLDEAITVGMLYRSAQYRAEDSARIADLGKAVRTKLYQNQIPTDEEYDSFLHNYVAAGGTQRTFAREMQRWMKDANESVVNQMAGKLGSQYSMRMQSLMGGRELPDYQNQPIVPTADVGDTQE